MWQKLGQHFLVDHDILQQMQRSLADIKKQYKLQHCLEIGPGEWALTKRLKSVFPTEQIIAFEADLTLEKKITKFFPLEQVVWGDVLEQEVEVVVGNSEIGDKKNDQKDDDMLLIPEVVWKVSINWNPTWFVPTKTLIAGNLPYYITSPILRKFFQNEQFDYGWFLIQKEVANKLATDAKKKSFLRWLMNYRYSVETILEVPPESFAPPPRVDSAVISVSKHTIARTCSLEEVIGVLDLVNQYSRKTLSKISKLLAKRDIQLVVPEELKAKRVEELSWAEMEMLAS